MDSDLADLCASQYGTFSRRQVMDAGVSRATIRQRLESGRWVTIHPSVYGLAGHRPSWRRRLWAAHLHAGPQSVIGQSSAGRLHGATEVPANTVELLVPERRTRAPHGVRWYRLIDLEPDDVQHLPGLPPVTSEVRTIVDLAATQHIARLRLIVESANADRDVDLAAIGARLHRIRRSGKPGVRKLARVLDDLGPGDGLSTSRLQRLGNAVIERAGLPRPTREHPLPNVRGRAGFVDVAWDEAMLIVEFDGRKWHHRFQQALADADRTFEAQALGWEVLRPLWEHATSDAERTAENLRAIYERRVALLRAAHGG